MKIFLFITLTAGLSGCASLLLPGLRSADAAAPLNLSNLKNQKDRPYGEIEKELTRGNVATGHYKIESTLWVDSLIEAEETQRGRKQMDDQEKTDKKIADLKAVYTKDKTCFNISVQTYSIDTAKFEYWTAKLEDHEGNKHEVTFTNTDGVESVPTSIYSRHDVWRWLNVSQACGPKLPLEKGIKLHLISTLMNDAPVTTLEWQAPRPAENKVASQK